MGDLIALPFWLALVLVFAILYVAYFIILELLLPAIWWALKAFCRWAFTEKVEPIAPIAPTWDDEWLDQYIAEARKGS